jgi:Terpene cyclase DEP1
MSTPIEIEGKRSLNSLKTLYLLLAIAGSILPWFWLLQDPAALMSPTLFLQRTFANQIATAWASDLLISSIVFFAFAAIVLQTRYANELKQLGVDSPGERLRQRLWILLYIALTFGIGLSCSLPLFLYRRELILERTAFR